MVNTENFGTHLFFPRNFLTNSSCFSLLRKTTGLWWCFCHHNTGHMASRQSEQDMMSSLMSFVFPASIQCFVYQDFDCLWMRMIQTTLVESVMLRKVRVSWLKSCWMCLSNTLPWLLDILSKLIWHTIG